MTVNHKQFGTGTVISQDSSNVTVDFGGTIRTLVTKFARLTNEDGSPFGVQFVAPVKKSKKTAAEKNMAWERTLTEADKRELKFENADGTKNHDAYNDFLEERQKTAWASIGY